MPVQFIQEYVLVCRPTLNFLILIHRFSPNQVNDAIDESSSKPVVIHYWNPLMGEESPFLSMFHDADENLGPQLSLYVVDSGFINPPHSPDELPLTALYVDGDEKESAPFHPDMVQNLIYQAV